MKDYNSFDDYAEELNDDDLPVLDEPTIRAWVSLGLGLLAFAILVGFLIYKN
jgi:hypothetical protein